MVYCNCGMGTIFVRNLRMSGPKGIINTKNHFFCQMTKQDWRPVDLYRITPGRQQFWNQNNLWTSSEASTCFFHNTIFFVFQNKKNNFRLNQAFLQHGRGQHGTIFPIKLECQEFDLLRGGYVPGTIYLDCLPLECQQCAQDSITRSLRQIYLLSHSTCMYNKWVESKFQNLNLIYLSC